VKITDRSKFDKFNSTQKYFSGSESHVYQSLSDMKKGNKDKTSFILKNTGDLVAAFDGVNNIGYIVPVKDMFITLSNPIIKV